MLNFSAPICQNEKNDLPVLAYFFCACKEKPNVFDSLSTFYKPVTEPVLSHDSTAVYFDSLKMRLFIGKKPMCLILLP
jgi:hypothetical protein